MSVVAAVVLMAEMATAACIAAPRQSRVAGATPLPSQARIVRSANLTLPELAGERAIEPTANTQSLAFLDTRTGLIASGAYAIATDQGGVYLPAPGAIQRTTDGGATWRTVWSAAGAEVSSITFFSPSIGFAAGMQFSTSSTTSDNGHPIWLTTADGGATWTVSAADVPASGQRLWFALHFLAASPRLLLAAVDANRASYGFGSVLLRSSDGGLHWAQVATPGWTPTGGIGFAMPGVAFATGFPAGGSATTGELWTSRDGGLTWTAVPGTGVPFLLLTIDFVDGLHGFAAGGNFAKYEARPWQGLLATTNGGRTWTLRYQSVDAEGSNPITRLKFIDLNHGWASIGGCSEGQNGPCSGPVMVTADGGRSWQTTDRQASELSPVGAREAWVIGSQVDAFPWHTHDAGATWHPTADAATMINSLTGTRSWMLAITPAGVWSSRDDGASWQAFDPPMLVPPPFSGGPSVFAQPPGTIFVVDDAGLRTSHDAGQHWAVTTLPGQETNSIGQIALSLIDSNKAFAVVGGQYCTKPAGFTGSPSGTPPAGVPTGAATIARSDDGGASWRTVATLSVQPSSASAINGLWAISGATGCNPVHQVLMLSKDSGKTWASEGLPALCSSVSVVTSSTIWLSCGDALLVSRDGALTWSRYQDPAGLPQFFVSGPADAWAYGVPGGPWHSVDGGQSWKPFQLTFPPAAD